MIPIIPIAAVVASGVAGGIVGFFIGKSSKKKD